MKFVHRIYASYAEQPSDSETGSLETMTTETASYVSLKIGNDGESDTFFGRQPLIPVIRLFWAVRSTEIPKLRKSLFCNSSNQTFFITNLKLYMNKFQTFGIFFNEL